MELKKLRLIKKVTKFLANTDSSAPNRISDKFQHGLCLLQTFKFCINLMDVLLVLSMKNKSCVVMNCKS